MSVDFTVSVGNLLNISVTVLTVFIAAVRIGGRLARMDMKLNMIWRWYKKEHGIGDGDDAGD